MNTVLFEVVTPDRVVLSEQVRMVTLQSGGGEIGILPRHMALATTVLAGVVKLKLPKGDDDLVEDFLFVNGGFVEVLPDRVTLLADAAETANQIDVHRAELAKERAEARLQQQREDVDAKRAEAALKRAIGRLETVRLYSTHAGNDHSSKKPE